MVICQDGRQGGIHHYDERDLSDLSHHGPKFTFVLKNEKEKVQNLEILRREYRESSDRSERQIKFIITEIII